MTTYCAFCHRGISVVGPLFRKECQRVEEDQKKLLMCDKSAWVIEEKVGKEGLHPACEEMIEAANAKMPKWI